MGTLSVLLVCGTAGVPASAQNTTTRVSVSSGGFQANGSSATASVTPDGRFVAFHSGATNLVPSDTNGNFDAFVHDRQSGTTERVSLTTTGGQALGGTSGNATMSADGRFVAFNSEATNLVPNDTNGVGDVFVRDRHLGTTIRVSVKTGGGQVELASFFPFISGNGRYVIFTSLDSTLVQGDTNDHFDVFRHDLETRTTVRVSVGNLTLTGDPTEGNGDSSSGGISHDGHIVSFHSAASNLVGGDSNGVTDAFVREFDLLSVTRRVSVGPAGAQANGLSSVVNISGDGRFVVFQSGATNLVANGAPGVYVHDRTSRVTSALVVHSDPDYMPGLPQISRDGRFACYAQKSAISTFNETFVIDRLTLNKTRVSAALNGDLVDGNGGSCAPNADASVLAFSSSAKNLVAGDTNNAFDIFVRTNGAEMALEKTAVTFGAMTSAGTFVSQTAAQTVALTQSGVGTASWKAVSNQPWLRVSPTSGSGSGTLSIDVTPATGLPPSGTVTGTIVVSLSGAVNTLPGIAVTLTLTPAGTTVAPFGTVDSPTDNRTGVTGAVPFTGWALDDLEVTRVSICRAAFGTETAPADPNCGGAAEIFVGFAVFIDGARPDVMTTFPAVPLASRAGWGFMVLTNFLPNQGNGAYRFTMRAQDREGHWSVLGTRTMTCANATATLPFGTLDTPSQGGTASGVSFVNFGWALTPLPKTIPIDGSTIRVMVDAVDVGPADYNHARPDIQALFPGFNNTNGAVGFRRLDTTLMTNGLHTISWAVTDDAGAVEGLGSRYFTVSNGVEAVTSAASAASTSARDVERVPIDTTPLPGRLGWDLEAPLELFGAGATGVTVIRSEEVNRVELRLGEGDYAGYLRTSTGLAPLPIGSRLDRTTNTFTWAPGVGFIGRYDLVFVRSTNGVAVSRREVRIVLHPKGRGSVGPQVVIDLPRADATVRSPFMIGGWAVDLDAAEGTGVATLHAWAFPVSGGAPIFLGATAYGGARPDVAAVHGDRFKASGFGLIAQGLPAGDYDLALFAWSTETNGFVAPKTVRVLVRP